MNVSAHVVYPSGDGVTGIQVRATLRTVFASRDGSGVTDGTGWAHFEIPTRGISGSVQVRFVCEGEEETGVHWSGETSVRWQLVYVRVGHTPPRREVLIAVERQSREITLGLSFGLRDRIRSDPDGPFLLVDVDELVDCLEASLPTASMALVGKVLEGALKVRGHAEGWWLSTYDNETLGQLLAEPSIKTTIENRIGSGNWNRLRGSSVFVRNVGVHQTFARVSMEEALASTRIAFTFLSRWWGLP